MTIKQIDDLNFYTQISNIFNNYNKLLFLKENLKGNWLVK